MPDSSTTCQAASCANGTVQAASRCDGAGLCVTPAITGCGEYQCLDASRCRTSCGQDSDCVGGYYCDGVACVVAWPEGHACTSPHQCQRGNCVDGVCCDTPCDGVCQYCKLAGAVGACFSACWPGGVAADPRRCGVVPLGRRRNE